MVKNPQIRIPIIISLGAIAGVLCRYYIGLWLLQNFKTQFIKNYFLPNFLIPQHFLIDLEINPLMNLINYYKFWRI